MSRYLRVCCAIFILLICLTSCSSSAKEQSQEISNYDSQVYSSLSQYFTYYYSMELWSFQKVSEKISSLDVSSDEHQYILGRIDSILDYNSLYTWITRQGQGVLEEDIVSSNLMDAIETYLAAQDAYLVQVKSALEDNPVLLDGEFRSENGEMGDVIRDLNIRIIYLDEEEEIEYIAKLHDATAYISQLANRLKR